MERGFHFDTAVIRADGDAEGGFGVRGAGRVGGGGHVGGINKFEEVGHRLVEDFARLQIRVQALADGVGDFGVVGKLRREFAREPRLFLGLGEEREDGVEMRARHAEDVRGPLDEFVREGLRADVGDVNIPLAEGDDAVLAGRLAVAGRDARGRHGDVAAMLCRMAEETLRHGAAADVSGADEEDALVCGHGEGRELYRLRKRPQY